MARHRVTLTLDDTAHAITESCKPNASSYVSEVLARNRARWRLSLMAARDAGWGTPEILEALKEMDGCWLMRADGFRGEMPVLEHVIKDIGEAKVPSAALEELAWEYWHENGELRALLVAGTAATLAERRGKK